MAKRTRLTTGAGKVSPPAPAAAGTAQAFLTSPLLHLLLLAAVALAAYANTFHVPFIFDDTSSIVDNPVIKDLSAFLSGAGYAYNPRRFVGYLTFALNYKLGGLDVTGYHAVNLVVHVISGWLVYALVRLTLRTPFFAMQSAESTIQNSKFKIQNFVPLFAALLFVAHPVQTQAVTYIVQRLASLAAMFYLLALVLYIRARLVQEDTGRLSPPPALALYFLSLISAILAMRTKEIAATLPVVVLLYEFSFFGAGARKRLLVLVPLLLTILIVPLGMLQAGKPLGELLSDVSEMARESQMISREDYLLTQFSVIVTYLRLLFFPVNQNLDYDYPVYHSLFAPRVLLSFLFLCAILAGAIWLYYRSGSQERGSKNEVRGSENLDFPSRLAPRTSRLISFGILWFFITLLIESSVIPISDVIFEHRLYLPSVGAFIALAAGASLLLRRYSPRTFGTAIALIIAILAAATWHRNFVWGDDLTLWRDTAAKSPDKYRPRNNLGNALLVKGKVDEAMAEFQTALALEPEDAEAHTNLGVACFKKGWTDQAIEKYMTAVRLNPGYAPAHNNLGEAYNRKDWTDRAIESYQAAVNLKPDFAEARNNLGAAYFKKGRVDRAIEEYQAASKIKPNEGNFHFNLAVAFEKKGWHEKAVEEYRLAVMLQPGDREALSRLAAISGRGGARKEAPPPADASAETAASLYHKGNTLTNSGRADEGIREYEAALRLEPDFADAHNNLGVAYGMKGNADKAIEHLETAIRLKPDDPDSHLNLARAYDMKGLTGRAEEERRLAEKIGKREAGGK